MSETLSSSSSSSRRTKAMMEHELSEMQQMISTGYTDAEIMHRLQFKERNFYKYKAKLYERSALIQSRKNEDALALEQQMLKDRLVRFFRLLEVKAGEANTKAIDTAACASIAREIGIDILKLESEGIRAAKGINYIVRKAESTRLVNLASDGELENKPDEISNQPTQPSNVSNEYKQQQQREQREDTGNPETVF